jgi:hypothetical protein
MAASSFVSAKVTDSAGVGVGSGAGVGAGSCDGAGCGVGASSGLAQAPIMNNVTKGIISIIELLLISLLFLGFYKT